MWIKAKIIHIGARDGRIAFGMVGCKKHGESNAMAPEADIALAIALLNLSKTVASADWVSETSKGGHEISQKMACRFDANHPQIGRFRLDIRICVGRLDQVSFHTHLSVIGKRSTVPVYRLDLNPGSIHVNPFKLNDTDSGRVFSEREHHEHSIEDDSLSGLVRFARPPKREINDFDSAWSYYCDRMLVSNPDDLPKPSPQGYLL